MKPPRQIVAVVSALVVVGLAAMELVRTHTGGDTAGPALWALLGAGLVLLVIASIELFAKR